MSSVRKSGGLALLWTKKARVTLASYSSSHIDAMVELADGGNSFHLTGIYGHPDSSKRYHTWNLIRSLHNGDHHLWFVGNDFNEILHNSEKQGGSIRNLGQMAAFNSDLLDCDLVDLGYMDKDFTWSITEWPH